MEDALLNRRNVLTEPLPTGLDAEFDMFMARAGIAIPPECRTAMLKNFAELRVQAEQLRDPRRTVAAEPSNVFRLSPMTREGK